MNAPHRSTKGPSSRAAKAPAETDLASLQLDFVCSVDDHHHAIIDCLLNKDVEGAAKSLARDLQGTVELLRDELGQADLQQAV